MALAVEEDEAPDPIDVSILGPDAVMQSPGRFANPIEESSGPGRK
jgi:hypothetical protein